MAAASTGQFLLSSAHRPVQQPCSRSVDGVATSFIGGAIIADRWQKFGHERAEFTSLELSLSIVYWGRVTGNRPNFSRREIAFDFNSTAKVHNGRDAGPIEYTLASHAALGAPRPREARVAQRRAPATKLWVSLFRQGGTHVPVEPSSRGASTRMRTRGTLARHQLARVSGKRTCTYQQGGASPIRHARQKKTGRPLALRQEHTLPVAT